MSTQWAITTGLLLLLYTHIDAQASPEVDDIRICTATCALDIAPVCGSDGNTYINNCTARCQAVTVVSKGRCGSATLGAAETQFESEGYTYAGQASLLDGPAGTDVEDEKMEYRARQAGGTSGGGQRSTGGPGSEARAVRFARVTRDGHMYVSEYGGTKRRSMSDIQGPDSIAVTIPSRLASASSDVHGSKPAERSMGSSNSARAGDSWKRGAHQPRGGARSLSGIVGRDERMECPHMPTFPFSTVGQLNVRDAYGDYICSGTMVGPDVLLTAAHCVYSRAQDAFYTHLDFSPARFYDPLRGGFISPYGTIPWVHVTVYEEYITQGNNYSFDISVLDIAVVKLGTRVGEDTGWLGISRPCVQDQNAKFLATMAGFPLDAPAGSCKTTQCYVEQTPCTANYLYHSCDTVQGQSGSAMWDTQMTAGNEMGAFVRAVHTLEWAVVDPTGNRVVTNSAVSITPFHYASISSWIEGSFNADDPEVKFTKYPIPQPRGDIPAGKLDISTTTSQGREGSA